MSTDPTLVPVILSGGSGSRLWPISRQTHPKPFMQLPDGMSLLQKTFLRAANLPNVAEVLTITNEAHYLNHKAAYEKIAEKIPATRFLLEPMGRNTAPAITLSALAISERYGPNTIMLVLPADHLIADIPRFIQYANHAFALASQNKLVTFGITPTAAETGFGYIECGEEISGHSLGHQVLQFIEKPNSEIAKSLVASKRFLWNAGMFCFKAGVLLEELAKHANPLLVAAKACWESTPKKATDVVALAKENFKSLPDISIDYALMEKSSAIAVLKCDFDWQDIGSFEAFKKLYPADQQGNTILGDAILIDAKDNLIKSDNRLIAAIGINHLAIIDTPDALLITERNRAQEVKDIVQTLKQKAHSSYLEHRTVIRPWGSYTVLEEGPTFKIKRIVVHPFHSLSLQLHHHRSEHWVVVEGVAEVVNGNKTFQLKTNESIFVPKETPHRLSNPTGSNLVIIEVQAGSYVGEDDIVRLEDVYGRVNLL